jgi:hypothetical protein
MPSCFLTLPPPVVAVVEEEEVVAVEEYDRGISISSFVSWCGPSSSSSSSSIPDICFEPLSMSTIKYQKKKIAIVYCN